MTIAGASRQWRMPCTVVPCGKIWESLPQKWFVFQLLCIECGLVSYLDMCHSLPNTFFFVEETPHEIQMKKITDNNKHVFRYTASTKTF